MINKKITLLTSFIFLTTSLFTIIPVKASNNITNTINDVNMNITTSSAAHFDEADKKLTVMVYSDADNNLEENLLEDIQEIKDGYVNNPNLNLIVLVDRNDGYSEDSSVFGEDFSDTRMYKIERNKALRIDGGDKFPEITKNSDYEANMGDAHTLKKFIDSCKKDYPADKYTLIMSNHGGGARDDKLMEQPKNPKAICWDDTDNGDCLYTAEISDVLTKKESVDLLAYDACLMGTAEVAYQYRPGNGSFQANAMVASAPVVWGNGFDYKKIFSRLKSDGGNNGDSDLTLGGKEQFFDPSTVTDFQLASIMVEAQRDSATDANVNNQSLCLYDLNKARNIKTSIDELATALWKENKKDAIGNLRGSNRNVPLIHYFNERSNDEWLAYPYFDLYDLCKKINTSYKFNNNIKNLAKNVMKNVDDMIVYSYGGSKFKGFDEGKNGLSVFLPDGNKIYTDNYSYISFPCWKGQSWYNSIDTTIIKPNYLYGKLNWCKDGQSSKINDVKNWFELLDCWFDENNTEKGGFNAYQW